MKAQMFVPFAAAASAALAAPAFGQSWISYVNETSTRLVSDPGLGANDPEEKDYAYSDFDHDGDVDLAVVRKTPFTSIGRRRNVLFMNEGVAQGQATNGVLVDRTVQYATAADDGGQGFLDLTDDRDVVAVDVNNDGWVDLVTATTYGQGLPKTISHPRVYINLGESNGVWLGFRYEQARIPTLPGAPNFCGVGAGDVTGDKAPDLYFVDYDSMTTSPFDDRLLINDGNGFFTDQSTTRLTSTMLDSGFGTTANIVDMNGDGKLDIVKSENGPIKTHYNNGGGFFTSMQSTYSGAAYHASVGDLNGDGRWDILASDDGVDRYLLNTGNGGNGQATFANLSFPSSSSGFGSVTRTVDLNNDGVNDTLVCDADVDAADCSSRQMHIYRNLGNLPNPTMADQGTGGIPSTNLKGTFDCAVIDLNGDGWKDLVIGRCSGTTVWIAQPPSGILFGYPQGMPSFLTTGQTTQFQVQLNGVGSAVPAAGSGTMFYSINGGAFTSVPMASAGTNLYTAEIPAVECTDIVKFYFTAASTGGTTFKDPSNAPTATYSAVAGQGTEIALEEHFEGSVATWTIANHASLTGGGWQQADPNGTLNAGFVASPETDAGNGADVQAFVTQNGVAGGAANVADVDGGPTWLTSPTIDLTGADATISYDRWFYCEDAGTPDADFLKTEVSNNNGASWVPVHSAGTTNGAWEPDSFRVGEFVAPTSQVRVRFWTQDTPNNSVTEAGVDNFKVERLICALPCPADIALPHNGEIDVDDLFAVINAWGACVTPGDCPADIAPAGGNGEVDVDDLFAVINAWGACP